MSKRRDDEFGPWLFGRPELSDGKKKFRPNRLAPRKVKDMVLPSGTRTIFSGSDIRFGADRRKAKSSFVWNQGLPLAKA